MKRGDIFEVKDNFKFSRHIIRKGSQIFLTKVGSCWVKFKVSNKPTYEFCVNRKVFKEFIKTGKLEELQKFNRVM